MKNKIEFYSVDKAIEMAYPILPASKIEMPWVKRSRAAFSNTIKHYDKPVQSGAHMCSGIVNLMTSGWVVTSFYDFVIETDGDGKFLKWMTPEIQFKMTLFDPHEFGDMAIMPNPTLKSVIKIDTPWRVKLPKGWNLMMLPLNYVDEDRFTASTGILDQTISNEINPILFWHKLNDKVFIKAGTPLCYLIPVPAKGVFDMEIRDITEREREFDEIKNKTQQTTWKTNTKLLSEVYKKFFG